MMYVLQEGSQMLRRIAFLLAVSTPFRRSLCLDTSGTIYGLVHDASEAISGFKVTVW